MYLHLNEMLSNAGGVIEEVQSLRDFLQEVAGESGVFGVSDDQNRQSKRICSLLCKVPDQTLLESELKRQLGFKYAPLCTTQSQNRQVLHQRSAQALHPWDDK